MEQGFWEAVRDAEEQEWLPDGFDIKPEDWAEMGWTGYPESAERDEDWPEAEDIRTLSSITYLVTSRTKMVSSTLYYECLHGAVQSVIQAKAKSIHTCTYLMYPCTFTVWEMTAVCMYILGL